MFEQMIPANVVPFGELDGIFLVKKPSTKIPGAEHYGVLVAGEPLKSFRIPRHQPVIIHRTADMRVDWAESTGIWELVDQVPREQTQAVATRAVQAFKEPDYFLLTDNCEHTARYITSGVKHSTQVGWYLAAGAVLAGLIALVNRNGN